VSKRSTNPTSQEFLNDSPSSTKKAQ
jgi:hypothetical protein